VVARSDEPIVPVRCYRCGIACIPCTCSPCPKCDGLLCLTCEARRSVVEDEQAAVAMYGRAVLTIGRDQAIPAHPGPIRCGPKDPPPLIITGTGSIDACKKELEGMPEPSEMVSAICAGLGTVAAGLVAGAAVVMMAAAAMFSGELPE
jgi:hypothetical protein